MLSGSTVVSPKTSSHAPSSNTVSHDSHEKINSWVSFTFYEYGAPLGGLRPPELRYQFVTTQYTTDFYIYDNEI